jgi:hypothetical protein
VDAPLHPDVEALRPLLGRWTGEGGGHYPTIDAFKYREDVTFGHVGKPFLAYRQATVRLDTGQPSHAEVGYLRGVGGGRIELVLAHPTGVAEVAEGEVVEEDGGLTLRLVSVAVAGTATAKEVTALARTITVTGDTLHYDLAMSAVGQPLQPHLSATLHRAGDSTP